MLTSLAANRLMRSLIKLMLAMVCLMTLSGFLGAWHWAIDLTSHFRAQYLAIQVLFAVLFMRIHRPQWLIAMIVFSLINLSQLVPFYASFETSRSSHAVKKTSIHLLHMNVFRFHSDRQRVLAHIKAVNPDLLSLAEFDRHWIHATANADVLKRFPYRITDPPSRLALFSKIPFQSLRIVPLKNRHDALIVAQIYIKKTPVALILMHPKPPIGEALYRRYQNHLQELNRIIPTLPAKLLLVGDLNTTPWSHLFRQIVQLTGLHPAYEGFGLYPTWPVHSPLVQIPIDHILIDPQWVPRQWRTGPSVGSDHLPVETVLEIPSG